MSLADWLNSRWIVAHVATAEEAAALVEVVDRGLNDSSVHGVSADGRLTMAYNAALQLATRALAAEGCRPAPERSHERAILSLRHTVGAAAKTPVATRSWLSNSLPVEYGNGHPHGVVFTATGWLTSGRALPHVSSP